MRPTPTRRSFRARAGGCSPHAGNDPDVVLIWRRGHGWESRLPAGDPRADILDLYLPLCSATPARPITVGHLGQSVDGFIATHSGDSQFVTGHENIVHLHALRALCDAVVVGAGTVAADDPQLTTRHVTGSHPLRVVFDPTRRLTAGYRVFTDAASPTLYVCEQERLQPGETHVGVAEVAGIGSDDAGGAVGALLRLLRERGCARVFVEGGGVTVSAFLEANLLDRLHLADCTGADWGGTSGHPAGGARPSARLRASRLSRVPDGRRRAVRLRPRGQRRTLQRHHAHGACLTGYLAPLQDGRRHRPRTRAASDDSAGYRAARGCKLEVSHLSKGLSMVRLFAILVGVVLLSAPALAQQRIVALITSQDGVNPTTSLWEARIEAGQVRDARPLTIHDGWGGPVVTAGGQMVVWRLMTSTGATDLAAFDRTSGTTYLLPDVQGLGVSDPTRPRLFVQRGGEIASLSPSGTHVVPNTAGLTPVGVSRDGGRLFAAVVVSEIPPREYSELRAIDTATGALLGAMPLGSGVIQVVPAPDETSVWVLSSSWVGTTHTALLRQLLLPSGAPRLSITLTGSDYVGFGRIEGVDDTLSRVVVSLTRVDSSAYSYVGGELLTFNTINGAEIGRVPLEGLSSSVLDAGAGTVLTYSARYTWRPVQRCGAGWLHVTSATTGQELWHVPIGTDACLSVAFAAPPLPPVLSTPVVTPNRTVTLSWARSPELTTTFTVEAGSAPGLSNLAFVPVMTGTTLTVPNVPPGTYYVRVRAWNYIGASVPSNEVVVEVR